METGAVVKNLKGTSGVEGGRGTCYQWKEKGQCSKGDQCSFRHESNDRAQKPEHTAATPSEPSFSRGRSVSKKRSIQGKSNHGAILRQPCRYYLKGTCTRSPCKYWYPPECQFYKTEAGWPGEWGPQGMSRTGEGGGLTVVPNLHVCKHFFSVGVARAGRERAN